jgi:hypothetical protein
LSLVTASALACACGGGVLGGTPQPDSGAPDAATAETLDAGAMQADGQNQAPRDATNQLPDADAADGEDVADADQSVDSCPSLGFGLSPTLMPPVFDPPAGTPVALGGFWSVTCPGSPPGTTIFYTTDNTTPTHSSMAFDRPMQFTNAGDLTIVAMCSGNGAGCFADSPPASVTYMVPPPSPCDCPPVTVTILPSSGTMNNDFVAQMSSPVLGASICYTTDGVTAPTCDVATGACTGNSKQYNPATLVPVNGTITDGTGTVVLQAIGCRAGESPGPVASATYVLAVADPSMDTPGPGTYPLSGDGGGLTPTIRSATMDSVNPVASPATISVAADGGSPSCAGGTQLRNPTTFSGQGGDPSPITSTTTVSAVGCKRGYKPSYAASFVYTIR